MLTVLWISIALIALRLAAELVLGALNRREVRRHADQPAAAARAVMDRPTYAKAVAYTLEKSRFAALSEVFDALVLMLVLTGGFLPWLYWQVGLWGQPGAAWSGALYLLIAGVALAIPALPFSWWSQFRLESRFGFNRSTPTLWITDRLKGLALTVVIGFPLLWALLALVGWAGDTWWLWGFALIFVFQIVMLVVYPALILPLFNRLEPLPAGELRDRLLALGERTRFRASSIQVMDGSKRSGHSNAFFTGFGRFRRIVLFDTLVAQLSTEELEAVLAHEIGHYRKGHIPQRIALSAVLLLAGLYVVGRLAVSPWFNLGFGLPAGEIAPTFLLFGLLSGVVTFWFTPLGNLLSRRHEYEADAFARDAMGSSAPLVGALHKLAEKNLSNLTPHPWFSAFYASHPTVAERERAMGPA
jgi:STE24 endopeptidase